MSHSKKTSCDPSSKRNITPWMAMMIIIPKWINHWMIMQMILLWMIPPSAITLWMICLSFIIHLMLILCQPTMCLLILPLLSNLMMHWKTMLMMTIAMNSILILDRVRACCLPCRWNNVVWQRHVEGSWIWCDARILLVCAVLVGGSGRVESANWMEGGG